MNPLPIGQTATAAAPKQSAMQEHAERLHDLAISIAGCNQSISAILDRLHGPQPEPAGKTDQAQTTPSGVLHVAQFGAERISQEIERLRHMISILERVA